MPATRAQLMRGWLVTACALLVVGGIGAVDVWDPPAIRLGAVYVLPVLAAAGWGMRHAGVVTAVTAAVVDALASIAQHLSDLKILVPMGLLRLGVYLACAAVMATMQRDRERLRNLATTDYATAVFNRRGLAERAAPLLDQCARIGTSVSLLYLDVNDFKTINDRYGHGVGDIVLQMVGQQLRLAVRGDDLVARVGGDEFAVLLADTDEAGAAAVAANIHSHLLDLAPPPPMPDDFRLGVSIGHVSRDGMLPSLDQLLTQADEAMYRAKSQDAHGSRLTPVALEPSDARLGADGSLDRSLGAR